MHLPGLNSIHWLWSANPVKVYFCSHFLCLRIMQSSSFRAREVECAVCTVYVHNVYLIPVTAGMSVYVQLRQWSFMVASHANIHVQWTIGWKCLNYMYRFSVPTIYFKVSNNDTHTWWQYFPLHWQRPINTTTLWRCVWSTQRNGGSLQLNTSSWHPMMLSLLRESTKLTENACLRSWVTYTSKACPTLIHPRTYIYMCVYINWSCFV